MSLLYSILKPIVRKAVKGSFLHQEESYEEFKQASYDVQKKFKFALPRINGFEFRDEQLDGLHLHAGRPAVPHKVTGMWVAYYSAYQNDAAVQKAKLEVEKTGARVLLIAGQEDEAWPAELSVRESERQLKDSGYQKAVKVVIFPHGSHLSGLMPNREREKRVYRMIPLIGLMYKTFGKYRKENLGYFAESEKEIIDWVKA